MATKSKAPEIPKEGPCVRCKKVCPEDLFCFGCKSFICEEHGEAPMGPHNHKDHHEPCRNCGDRVENEGDDLCARCE